ncbi:OpgC domain-containing protein [Pseudoxanthomonas sp.]|uniref:OpgC domain-containing protein n=1 Tax=Pseudoxanthomonas sp. TaxID=1871049 RepID=UPI00261C9DA9|nr:OpgC domain-containing protein [Pseudoxanthomonas sp.]WDS37129.1 MAG: OpgC domain-containing protein [Pseudoxanthomonas sp.]
MASRPPERMVPLDFIRGICLIVITLNHYSLLTQLLGYPGKALWTPTTLGYSSSAELFFFISGYLVGLIYAQPGMSAGLSFVRLSHRAGHLYLYNALAFLCLLALCGVLPEQLATQLRMHDLVWTPHQAARAFLLLRDSPPLLDVLQIYVIFLLACIPLVPLVIRWPRTVLAASLALYVLSQWQSVAASLGQPGESGYFNRYAWQLLFIGGIVGGRLQALQHLQDAARHPRIAFALLSTLAAMTVFFLIDRKVMPLTDMRWWDKRDLAPLRLAHAALVLFAWFWLCGVLQQTRLHRWGGHRIVEAFSTLGRQSLEMFTFGIALSYAGALLLRALSLGRMTYLAIAALLVLLMWLFARYLRLRHLMARTPQAPAT